MLQEADNTSYHQSHTICSPLPLGMCHFLLEWANSATNSSSIFYHLSPLPYPASWRKEEKKRREWKGKEKRSTPASSKIREISFGAILEVAMVMDNSNHQGAEVTGAEESAELQSYGHTGAERAPEGLPNWENDQLVQPTLHTPTKPFWWRASLSTFRWNITWPSSQLSILWGSGGVLFPSCSNGPSKEQFEGVTNCLWGFWVQLIQRGAQFPLCCVPRGHSFLLYPKAVHFWLFHTRTGFHLFGEWQ